MYLPCSFSIMGSWHRCPQPWFVLANITLFISEMLINKEPLNSKPSFLVDNFLLYFR